MNFKLLVIAASLAFAAQASFAADGTVIVNGEITAQACTVSTGSVNKTITLDKADVSTIKTGSLTAEQKFTIDLACSTTGPTVAANFSTAGHVSANGYLDSEVSGGATNIEIALLDSASKTVKLNQTAPDASEYVATAANVSLAYSVAYSGSPNGAPTPGQVTGTYTYNLAYQ